MRYLYLALTVAFLAYVWFRSKAIAREKGHIVKPPADLRGSWKGEGWTVELSEDAIKISGPDGAAYPVRGVLKQSYRQAYTVTCGEGLLLERFVFAPLALDERRFTRMRLVINKDVRTICKAVLERDG